MNCSTLHPIFLLSWFGSGLWMKGLESRWSSKLQDLTPNYGLEKMGRKEECDGEGKRGRRLEKVKLRQKLSGKHSKRNKEEKKKTQRKKGAATDPIAKG
ncbi:hypothetical protein ACFX1T_009999 [Malus domestica]